LEFYPLRLTNFLQYLAIFIRLILLVGAWWEQRQRILNEPVYAEEAHVAAISQDIEGGAVDNPAVELTVVGSVEEGNVEALRAAEATVCEPKRPKPAIQAVALPAPLEPDSYPL
jgi:hypothetical protein